MKPSNLFKYIKYSALIFLTLYFALIAAILFEYNKLSFDSAFYCAKQECTQVPFSRFFFKGLAKYKYHDKKAIQTLDIPPILWAINLEGQTPNDEIIQMIDHFIKMGFDINQSDAPYMSIGPHTPLKAAILYKNIEWT